MLAIKPESDGPDDEPPVRKQRTWLRDLIEVAVIALVLYLIIWNCLQTVRVDGESMMTTLSNSDLLLASKISYKLGDPQRGDIVILIPPIDPTKDFIKRVVAVPGDQIEIDGNDGTKAAHVLIKPGGQGDAQMLNETYVNNEVWLQPPGEQCCDPNAKPGAALATLAKPTWVTVPSGEYFVMGDNRNRSEDSRYFGFVARDKIVAKAFIRIWPLFHFGLGGGPTLIPATTAAAVPLWWMGPRRRRKRRRTARLRRSVSNPGR